MSLGSGVDAVCVMLLGQGALAAAFAFSLSLSHAARARMSGTASAAAIKRPRGPADMNVLSVVWSGRRLHTQRRGARRRHPIDQQMHHQQTRNMTCLVGRPRRRLRSHEAELSFEE